MHRELRLYYQPKVDIGTGEVVGFEALLRWHHPELGVLTPAEFLSAMIGSPVVSSSIQLARTLGLVVIAEGVESEAQGRMLLELGCPLVQGHGIAEPMPAERVLPWLQARPRPAAPGGLSSR